MEFRYGASCVVLPSTRDHSLGMGRLHAMCWSSVTLSAMLGKVSLPNSSQSS